jgi:site-specific DNA recombinase
MRSEAGHDGSTRRRSSEPPQDLDWTEKQRQKREALLEDIRAHKIDVVVVYKVDRLTRSLADFAKLVELFEAHGVSFVSVTQQFNTTSSMGRLTLNVLESEQHRAAIIIHGVGVPLASRNSTAA